LEFIERRVIENKELKTEVENIFDKFRKPVIESGLYILEAQRDFERVLNIFEEAGEDSLYNKKTLGDLARQFIKFCIKHVSAGDKNTIVCLNYLIVFAHEEI